MARRQQIKKAPTYYGRLFEDQDEALNWLERMSRKMSSTFTMRCVPHKEYKGLWHAYMYDTDHVNEEGYIIE